MASSALQRLKELEQENALHRPPPAPRFVHWLSIPEGPIQSRDQLKKENYDADFQFQKVQFRVLGRSIGNVGFINFQFQKVQFRASFQHIAGIAHRTFNSRRSNSEGNVGLVVVERLLLSIPEGPIQSLTLKTFPVRNTDFQFQKVQFRAGEVILKLAPSSSFNSRRSNSERVFPTCHRRPERLSIPEGPIQRAAGLPTGCRS